MVRGAWRVMRVVGAGIGAWHVVVGAWRVVVGAWCLTGTFLWVLGVLGVLAGALVWRSGHVPRLPSARAIRSRPPPVHGPPARIAIFRRAGQDRQDSQDAQDMAPGAWCFEPGVYDQGRLGRTPKAVLGVHPRRSWVYIQEAIGSTPMTRLGVHVRETVGVHPPLEGLIGRAALLRGRVVAVAVAQARDPPVFTVAQERDPPGASVMSTR